ncbi:hypothetical protein D3C81_1920840 [compost metagenome]
MAVPSASQPAVHASASASSTPKRAASSSERKESTRSTYRLAIKEASGVWGKPAYHTSSSRLTNRSSPATRMLLTLPASSS